MSHCQTYRKPCTVFRLLFTAVLSLCLAALSFGTTTPTRRGCQQPYYQYNDSVPGIYIVNFTEGYTLQQHYNTLQQTFNVTELDTGYFANLTTNLLSKVLADCGVHFVEDDAYGIRPEDDDGNIDDTSLLFERGSQKDAPYPLFQLSASQKFPSDETYYYVDKPGEGVDIYIVESGINHPQDEFMDDDGHDRVVDEINYSTDLDYTDTTPNAGHGTRVASAIGGNGYGIAKGATLRTVKYERYGEPDNALFLKAMIDVIGRHNRRKGQGGFKGSIINMSLTLRPSRQTQRILDVAYNAGISLVASGGNRGYNTAHFPSSHPRVISVAGSSNDYTPWRVSPGFPGFESNFGENLVTLWAPGQRVPLCNKNGREYSSTGTSFAAGYVSGIVAIFYGVEGTNLDPGLAQSRLMAQTDDWITLPEGTDWHNTPTAFANTGNRKGFAQNPPVQYVGGPQVNSASGTNSSTSGTAPATTNAPTQGCESPNHDGPLSSFTLDQGQYALVDFISDCQGVELQPGGPTACTLYFNPCSQQYGAKAVDVIMTVTQTEWKAGVTSTFPNVQEMNDAVEWIMNSCDTTTTTTAKWGGYQRVSVDSGERTYNISANQNGQYPAMAGLHTTTIATMGGQEKDDHCAAWLSS